MNPSFNYLLRADDSVETQPRWATPGSFGLDIFAARGALTQDQWDAAQVCLSQGLAAQPFLVRTGLWIDHKAVDATLGDKKHEFCLKLEERSSGYRMGFILHGGKIDLDYPNEIQLYIWPLRHNVSFDQIKSKALAQMYLLRSAEHTVDYRVRLGAFNRQSDERIGGFGSTNNRDNVTVDLSLSDKVQSDEKSVNLNLKDIATIEQWVQTQRLHDTEWTHRVKGGRYAIRLICDLATDRGEMPRIVYQCKSTQRYWSRLLPEFWARMRQV